MAILPPGRMGQHFSKVWTAISFIFLILILIAFFEYRDAKRVHTETMETNSQQNARISVLEKYMIRNVLK